MYRKRKRIKDLDDRSIMAPVLLIDLISSQGSDGMESVSPFFRPLYSSLTLPYLALLKEPTHSPRVGPPIALPSKLKLIPDRSNGFEKKYFQHQNTVARRTYQADQMGMEDM